MTPHYYQEKIFFALSSLVSSLFFGLGAIFSEGDVRWLFVTMGVSTLGSSFLSMTFRRQNESIRVVIGRCGITILAAIFGSKAAVHYWQLKVVNEDIALLGAVTLAVTIIAYFPGHSLFKSLDRNSTNIGSTLLSAILRFFNIPPKS